MAAKTKVVSCTYCYCSFLQIVFIRFVMRLEITVKMFFLQMSLLIYI